MKKLMEIKFKEEQKKEKCQSQNELIEINESLEKEKQVNSIEENRSLAMTLKNFRG